MAGGNKFAKNLRKLQTPEEKRLWFLIKDRQLGSKFRRQVVIESYIADFCCFEKRLIIELDGNLHKSKKANDLTRTKYLESQDFTVLRFWNSELEHERTVINKIKDALSNPSSVPPKAGHLLSQGEKNK
ncbi:MAG: hypothetical protein A3J07_03940 [Candidatus Doudnabacteria bacterium RIFCSPLOWO2_02_FULL_49_13]|uniref:DUF559 domain-containing protein n=1 Tax=Candidatus Doudnabacteria bacterium RIFCSPHIGHO2_12_FULL_48_16 TaxID=1817838 RepID=A0A1F5PJM2_9BACT|nr:MAG: hypothetical protein A3B77_02750 [Candidatus Doudnabacteria bacterium RIFCSPHIGHO2_02_FULL_49_24]OGE89485.1 MAG: hypothetical protein A2760_00010 [Candidatus Doudnabacteria bacterium RIFCSPHIGHO2_01_FULL_50_67]OGE90067.1 MAG: hypothetical protein A3E29_03085 [Candidatus Doudnabacteria bacterium RIFCSPHIGHO2_12_FULL_48_16]OGE96491.1 MAG: hypothetical protein A2990_04470 [Candidatus Doudnabacteria bacterium RIFCSPLOWO2_01_FULL_49_40]OGF03210.1 MAG: hypothetical protein A3J07_03940 [Candid